MTRDIDIIIQQVLARLPALVVRQHDATHSSDDDGVWCFSVPGVKRDIHVESSLASCPFLIETNEQSCAEALRASSVNHAVELITEYLIAASKQSGPIHLSAERYWQ